MVLFETTPDRVEVRVVEIAVEVLQHEDGLGVRGGGVRIGALGCRV
jgi:hypothetical protein